MYNPVFQLFYAHYLIQPLYQLNHVGTVFIPILEMGNLRHREDTLLAQDHTASNRTGTKTRQPGSVSTPLTTVLIFF